MAAETRMSTFHPPLAYSGVNVVNSFDELVSTRFEGGVNALCWQRTLAGNFNEVVERLQCGEEIVNVNETLLKGLILSSAGNAAVNTLIEDQERLRGLGLSPVLDCIHQYPRDNAEAVVPTDVYSFHADSATVETDTYLCSYTGAASEGLRHEEAQRCVDLPETRAALLSLFGGEDGSEFVDFLRENCYDLHYISTPDARPFSFGLGNLWRIAVEYPGCPVPPCVHRAPDTALSRTPRLLLIS
jgi:hypothetical protein